MSNFAKLDKQDVVVEETMDSIIMEGMDMSFGVMYDISAMNKWKSFVHSAFQNKELLSYVKKQCESIYKSKRDGNKKQRLNRGIMNRKVYSAVFHALNISFFNLMKKYKIVIGTNDIGDDFNIPLDDYCVAVVCRTDVQDHIECVFLVTEDTKKNIVVNKLTSPKDGELAKIWFETVCRT